MDEPLILDRYRLVERLAVGGSAEVWRAHDEQLDRPVAVKRLHAHLMPDEASRMRLAAEARAAAGLSHPVIVDVYDIDTEGDSPAIVMELVDGESLAARIAREGALAEGDAARITADVAEALYHAHQRGVVHRDVKPGNVLLSVDGRTRLVDFGIARSLAESADRLTQAGTVMGTLSAMAPEQLAGGPIGPRTDLFGLGVVLHEALTGLPPYAAGTPVALADAQRAGPPSLEGVDRALAAVTEGCLAYDASDRPVHAGAAAAALRAWSTGDPGPALALAPPAAVFARSAVETGAITQPIPVTPAAPAAVLEGSRGAPPARARRRVPLALLGAAAALATLAVLVLSGLAGDPGTVGEEPSPSASPPAAVDPEWLAGAVEEIEEACGDDAAETAAAEMATMDADAAEAHFQAVIASCADDDDDDGNGNGNGRGRGNGNGRGRGN
jgi:tRNA A-37 threonylcarbamoyl transferase component Bud32